MRFEISIDCSPEEARRFFGVPDVAPMQQAFIEQLQATMSENLKGMDSDSMAKLWGPAMLQGWQGVSDMQQKFWQQVASATGMAGMAGAAGAAASAAKKTKQR